MQTPQIPQSLGHCNIQSRLSRFRPFIIICFHTIFRPFVIGSVDSNAWPASFPHSPATAKSHSVQLNSVSIRVVDCFCAVWNETLLQASGALYAPTTQCILLNISFDDCYAADIVLCIYWWRFINSSNESAFYIEDALRYSSRFYRSHLITIMIIWTLS